MTVASDSEVFLVLLVDRDMMTSAVGVCSSLALAQIRAEEVYQNTPRYQRGEVWIIPFVVDGKHGKCVNWFNEDGWRGG